MACREAEHPPSQERRPVHLVMIRREPGTPGVPSPAGHPSTTVDLDGEHECGPCEIEPPSSTEVLGERVFRLRLREPRCPDQDQEPQLEWGWRSCSLRPYAWTGWFNGGLRGDHGITMRPPVHPRGRGGSPDWGNPGWERRNGPPRPHHGRSGAGMRTCGHAGAPGCRGCGRDDPRDGRRENGSYLTSRSPVRSGH